MLLTVQHALHKGSSAQVAALDNMHEHEQIGGQPEEDGGHKCADNCKQNNGAEIAEKLALLQCEACREHYRRQKAVEECSWREAQCGCQPCIHVH